MLRVWLLLAGSVLLSSLTALGQADTDAVGRETHRIGFPVDWSFSHVIASNPGEASVASPAQQEPRVLYGWLRRHRGDSVSAGERLRFKSVDREHHEHVRHHRRSLRVDWSFPLGSGTVAPTMSPAKFSFDVAATPSCGNDYVVYGLNVSGSSSQPNLVRFNNIYAGAGGLCGDNPMVESAYILIGQILTSPALSLDGSKVAVVGTIPGGGSIFQVLTWGTSGNNGSFDSTSRTYSAAVPGVGNNAVLTPLFYSIATTTFSAPFIDYSSADHAYFGDDNGKLYRTTCVFHCPAGISPQVDTGWPIQVAATNVKLSPPVLDHVSNKVFVGSSDGNLHVVDLALCPGATCSVGSVSVGSPNSFGGVLDGPIVDSTFGTVFAFAGDNGSGNAVAIQTNTSLDLAPNITFLMGSAAFFNVYDGTPDEAYFQNTLGGSTAAGNLFICGPTSSNGAPELYRVPFKNSTDAPLSTSNPPQLDTSTVQSVSIPGNPGLGCSPLTELDNGITDRLFFSHASFPGDTCPGSGGQASGCMLMYNISPGSPISDTSARRAEAGGTSGIVIDNTSALPQASSLYFANEAVGQCSIGTGLGTASYCAVKLTQSALQ